MIKNISYCLEWNSLALKPIKPYTVAKAEERHNKGERYCAVIEMETGERITVDYFSDTFYVLYFDDKNRRSLSYTFEKVSDKKLFLWDAWFPHYFGETDKIERAEIYYFKENGEVKIIKGEPRGENRYESDSIQNVERNYEEIPSFGNYESIIRRER